MVGRRIKILREEKGISQAELAVVLGVSRMSINNYENEKRIPDIDFVLSASNYFGVTLEYLAGQTEYRYKDDINVSLEKTEKLFRAMGRLPQRESQEMISNLTEALEKAAELNMPSDILYVLTACCIQIMELLREYEKLGKEVAPMITELKRLEMPKDQSLNVVHDRLRSIYGKSFELMDTLAYKTKSCAKAMVAELEKLVQTLLAD